MATKRILAALLGACALAAASDAWAQTVQLEFVDASRRVAGKDDCDAKSLPYNVRYSFPNGLTSGVATRLDIFLTTAVTCPDEPSTAANAVSRFSEEIGQNNATGTVQFGPADITLDPVCADNVEKSALICAVARQEGTGTTAAVFKDSVTVVYDSQDPAKAVLNEVTGGDRALNLSWRGQDDVNEWIVILRKVEPILPDTGDDTCAPVTTPDAGAATDGGTVSSGEPRQESFGGDLTGGRVSGLVNGQVYEVTLQAVDEADNDGEPSEPLRGAPVKVDDFFTRYVCAGGDERGGYGCTTAGWALLPLASLALLPLLRRRAAGGRR